MEEITWTGDDMRAWRSRLRWTQARAADALLLDVADFKKLERGSKRVVPRMRKLAILVERDHVRSMHVISSDRQVFATAAMAADRMEALERDGKLTGPGGRRRLRYLSLYSGQAGCTAAFQRLGSDAVCVGYCEVDPAANALLRHRFPDTVRLGSVEDVSFSALRGHVDIIVGGPPCQSFSVSGKQRGLGDPRGSQILHFLRAVEAVRPRWFVMENVPGLLSTNNGEDFEVYLDAAVEELGYSVAYRQLSAQHFGLPQRRKRLWIVGEHNRSGGRCGEILSIPGSEGGHIKESGIKRWKANAARTDRRVEAVDEPEVDWSLASSWLQKQPEVPEATPMPFRPPTGPIWAFKPMQSENCRGIAQSTEASPTLSAASGGNCTPAVLYRAVSARHATVDDVTCTVQVGPDGGWSVNAAPLAMHADEEGEPILRRFTPRETLMLQGFDPTWQDLVRVNGKPLTDTDKFRMSGNAWPIPVAAWVLERLIAVHYALGGGCVCLSDDPEFVREAVAFYVRLPPAARRSLRAMVVLGADSNMFPATYSNFNPATLERGGPSQPVDLWTRLHP